MRRVFQVITVVLLVAEVIQFYFAAFGVFTAPANDSQFVLHQMNGRVVLPLLCLLVIAAAALARAPGRLIGFSAIPLGLLAAADRAVRHRGPDRIHRRTRRTWPVS